MTLGELLENVKLEGEPYIKVVDYDITSSKDEFGYDFKENYIDYEPLSDANAQQYKDYTVASISPEDGHLVITVF